MKELQVRSDQEMVKWGELLGEQVKPGDLLFLSGNLGAGKTTLVKGIAKGMGIGDDITSPTFQLIKTYYGKYRLNHLDLYRLGGESEIEVLDLEELTIDGVTVIEWGDFLIGRLFNEYLEIKIQYGEGVSSRSVTLIPSGARYERLIEELYNADLRP